MVLEGTHNARPPFDPDWAIVKGSRRDPEKWKLEISLRDQRNMMIRESLDAGRSVFYTSSGTSMWPLVQSNDACLFHLIQAVTADYGVHAIHKKASEIGVGDIVFCQVQPSQQYYAHIVLSVEDHLGPKYWIGNIEGNKNGWCLRQHIFGILVDVQHWDAKEKLYRSRLLPKTVFRQVQPLVKEERWKLAAAELCKPMWELDKFWFG